MTRSNLGAIDSLAQDIRFAARTLRVRPATMALATGVLALGIAASTTIQDVVRALATDAIPFERPARLATVEPKSERGTGVRPTYADVLAWESQLASRVTVGAYTMGEEFIGGGEGTSRVPGARVSGDFFGALAVDALIGRVLSPADLRPGAESVVVIAERLWEERFGVDPDILGTAIRLDGRVHTVIGVVPSGLQYPPGVEFWTPLTSPGSDALQSSVSVLARLASGVSPEEAGVALRAVQGGLDRSRPEDERVARVDVVPLSGRPEGSDRIALILLQAAVLVLLLITATNAGGLLLARAVERRQEIAIRTSLGASRMRVIRQLFVENGLLSIAAAVVALIIAGSALAALREQLRARFGASIMGWERLGLDWRTIGYALLVAAVLAIALAIVPALRVMRDDLTAHLRQAAPGATVGRGASRLARILLSAEVALALMLVATAGLLTRSQLALLEADPGFQAESVLAVEWALPPDGYQDALAVGGLQERLLERFEATSGVQSAAFASNLPMSGAASGRRYQVQGSDPAATAPVASWRSISTDYFSTLGISLRRGRGFEAADGAGGPRVAVINEALVDRHWPGGADPLGRQLEMDGEVWTVVGVAADVHDLGAQRGAGPTIYVPQAQATTRAGFLVIRVAGEPPGFAGTVRREIWAVDPGVAVDDVRTLQEMVHGFYAGSRVLALLMGVFAVVSLLITVASLYALVTHHVAQHRREIGVRLTLGARPKDVLVATVARVATWVAVGIAVGLGLSAVAAQLLRSVLYGVGALDPVVFVLAPVGFLIAAMIAAYVPARAASRVDPVEVLRT